MNLRVDGEGDDRALVVDDAASPAQLSVGFPPQTIAESAYFRSSAVVDRPVLDPMQEGPHRLAGGGPTVARQRPLGEPVESVGAPGAGGGQRW